MRTTLCAADSVLRRRVASRAMARTHRPRLLGVRRRSPRSGTASARRARPGTRSSRSASARRRAARRSARARGAAGAARSPEAAPAARCGEVGAAPRARACPRASASSTACSAAASCPARWCCSAARRGSASRRSRTWCSGTCSAPGARTLYVSGEESAEQVRLRAERLGWAGRRPAALEVPVLAETELERDPRDARRRARRRPA